MAKNVINQWDSNFLERSLLFQDLKVLLDGRRWDNWPGCNGLMALLQHPVVLKSGMPLTMQAQDHTLPFPEMGYEERIYRHGIISTREQNWHDFFNALSWLLFPTTKNLLNQLHMLELEQQHGKKRTFLRDTITHLDESGVIVASCNTGLIDALKSHQWKYAFVESRPLWQRQISAFIFGHGLYEKAFNPFIGFTGKAYYLEADEAFFQRDKLSQYLQLDKLLEADISKNLTLETPGFLKPLPVLGVPGWYNDNLREEFYNNSDYFRPLRKKLAG